MLRFLLAALRCLAQPWHEKPFRGWLQGCYSNEDETSYAMTMFRWPLTSVEAQASVLVFVPGEMFSLRLQILPVLP